MIQFFHDFLNDKGTFIWTVLILIAIYFVFYIYKRLVGDLKIESEVKKQLAAIQEKQKKGE